MFPCGSAGQRHSRVAPPPTRKGWVGPELAVVLAVVAVVLAVALVVVGVVLPGQVAVFQREGWVLVVAPQAVWVVVPVALLAVLLGVVAVALALEQMARGVD